MSKFNTTSTRPAVSSPVTSERTASGTTHEAGAGYERDAKSELFLLAVSNMVGESTFYEKADARDDRYETLVRTVALADPVWTLGFLRWLRGDGNMRSASLVGVAEAVKARLEAGDEQEYVTNRHLVDAVLQRPDEPGEFLAYWTSRHGRAIPKPVKRGVADAIVRLYNERALLKYDTDSKGYRFGDVIELAHPTGTHPEIKSTWKGDLFEHALDRRHNRDNPIPESLQMLECRRMLMALPVDQRRPLIESYPDTLSSAGMTWEALAGWLQGPMDAKAWEAVIPSMGYMALLRNLRNFDEAEVPDDVAAQVAVKLADPDQVAKSRQLPMRFLSAYRAAPSLRWAYPLEQALGHCLANIPKLSGRTLIMVDTSTSMKGGFSKDGALMRWDAAATFGVALAQRCASAEVVSFSSAQYYMNDPRGVRSKVFPVQGGESLLRSLDRWKSEGYFLGGGTETALALRQHFAGHDRVVILTDEQAFHDATEVTESVPKTTPMYTWNLAGYQHGHAPSGDRNRHAFGGLTDQAFRMVPLLEAGQNGTWPWL